MESEGADSDEPGEEAVPADGENGTTEVLEDG